MTGYTRQQFYVDEDTILAEHSNDEFNLLEASFDTTTGHKHDGTAGEGHTISLLSDNDGDTKIVLDESPDNDQIKMYASGTNRVTVDSNGLVLGGRFFIVYNASNDTLDIGTV